MQELDLTGSVVAVVGGDEREQEIARLAAETGAVVRAYGFTRSDHAIQGVAWTASAGDALDGADFALFPIPGQGPDGALFAPDAAEPIHPDRELLGRMSDGAAIVLGWADEQLRSAAEALGLRLCEYEQDTELMLLRGPAIVEGVVGQAIANTEITIHDATVAVVGHGNVGRLLARTLVLLGARVHVFARNPVQRADAFTAGAVPHALSELPGLAAELDMVFSTVPAPVVSSDVLRALRPGALVVDVAAPPGGVDLDAARAAGHRTVWARGMGRRAPVTVGRSQWSGIARRIADIKEAQG